MLEIIYYFHLFKYQNRRWIMDVNLWTELVVYSEVASVNGM